MPDPNDVFNDHPYDESDTPLSGSEYSSAKGETPPVQTAYGEGARDSEIGGIVWLDVNDSRLQGPNEPSIPDVLVVLYDENELELARQMTDENGRFRFDGLAGGTTYIVQVDASTLPPTIDGEKYTEAQLKLVVPLFPGEKKGDVNFGFQPVVGSIGDMVYLEKRSWFNRVKEGSRAGLAGVGVSLFNKDGLVRRMETNGNGRYIFHNLLPGQYTVAIDTDTLPENARLVMHQDGAAASEANVYLGPGESCDDVDFYVYQRDAVPWLLLFMAGLIILLLIFWPLGQKMPDLQVQLSGLTVTDQCDGANLGGRVTDNFQVLVINAGDADVTRPFEVTLSNGETITLPGLRAGEQTELAAWADEGSLPLTVTVDKDGVVAERNEDNNSHTLTLNLLTETRTTANCTPDLSVMASCDNNNHMVSARVNNWGIKNYDAPFTVMVNEKPFHVSRLAAGDTIHFDDFPWDGNAMLHVRIEGDNLPDESRLDNNTIRVAGCQTAVGPDLTVLIMGEPPVPASCDLAASSLRATAVVINNGGIDITDSFVVSMNGVNHTLNGLPSGELVELPVPATAGSPVMVKVDINSEVDETDETNNEADFRWETGTHSSTVCIDLTIQLTALSTASSCGAASSGVTAVATITNAGVRAVGEFDVRIGDAVVTVPGLGANRTYVIEENVAGGVTKLTAVVDSASQIDEEDESNNTVTVDVYNALTVKSRCDLTIATKCTYNPTTNSLDLVVKTTNEGAESTGPYWIQVNEQQLRETGLQPGRHHLTTFHFPLGTANFIAKVDAANQITENNETNNRSSLYLNQLPPGECGPGNTTLRIDFEIGRDAQTGVRQAGVFKVYEENGREIASWYARVGEVDSGWISNASISVKKVLVYVLFYPANGGTPVQMEFLNPAPNSSFGWLAQNTAHALEIQYPGQ